MSEKHERRNAWKWLMMHLLFMIYSMTTVISRKIGGADLLSTESVAGYLLIILCMGIYALGWQQVLKSFSLSQAFANKAVVVIWGLVWGSVLFGERMTPAKLTGAALIIAGVLFFASEGEEGTGEQEAGGHG